MTLPTHTFDEREVKFRYGERYVSETINKKMLGLPRGVYYGFVPSTSGLVLTLAVDSERGASLCRTRSDVSGHPLCVDVVLTEALTLDFSDHDFGAEPTAYVICTAAAEIGVSSTASIFTRSTPAVDPYEQQVCVVTKPGATLEVDVTMPTAQSSPHAWASAPLGYGFMRDGAIEELQQAVAMVGEITDARTDLLDVYHDWNPPTEYGLTERIEADILPDAIAGRLGLQYRLIFSEDHPATTGSQVNVSGSFSEVTRTRLPVQTFEPDGSESQAGIVTDAIRNICFFVLVGTHERPVDESLVCGYGRLLYEEIDLTGTSVTFPVGPAVTVTGVGTAFLSELEAGDLVLAPDGLYYQVASVADNFTFDLTAAVAVPGVTSPPPKRRRWTLQLRKNEGGVEAPFNITGSVTVRFFFGGFFSSGESVFDASLMLAEGGEIPPLPDADVDIPGGALMHPNVTNALAGAVQSVLAAGATIGAGAPVYALGFTAASDGGSNVANINMTGPQGVQGAPGTGQGPTGPTGATGVGFDNYNASVSGIYAYNPGPTWSPVQPPSTVLTHSVTYPSTLKFLTGGVRQWEGAGGAIFWQGDAHFTISNIFRSGPQLATGNISNTWPSFGSGAHDIALFLNGAG